MPAKSKAQQHLMGMVHATQTGQIKAPSEKVAKLAKSMTKKSAKDYASTKTKKLPAKVKKTKKESKKIVKENYENNVSNVHAVLNPYPGCEVKDLVHEIDPIMGASHLGIDPENIHGVYPTEEEATKKAEEVHGKHLDEMEKLEEKKESVSKKLTSMIDKLESKRKDHMKMAKENPDHAGEHKKHVSHISSQIEDLMDKLEKVSKSKKKQGPKKDLKESEGADISTFENMLKSHDWYYRMSDSDSEYQKGWKEEVQIKKMIDQLGDQAKELYKAALLKHFPNAKV